MSDPRVRGLPARAAPAPPRGVMRWIASEWGLAFLALILAFLVWAVVWGRISEGDKLKVEVSAETSDLFVAYPDGPVVLRLDGPRGELEDARALLGSKVRVDVPDLPPGDDTGDYLLSKSDQFTFPFPRRLVAGVESGTTVRVFRWERKRVHFQDPEILGLPPGIRCDVELDPPTATLRVPGTTVGDVVIPDPIDVAADLRDLPDDLELKPKLVDLAFDDWAGHPELGRYRSDVRLPEVTATLKFRPEEARTIRNRVEFNFPESANPDHFEVTADVTEDIIVLGRFEGSFVGLQKDLDALEAQKDAWRYIIRIPPSKLPAEAGDEVTETANLPIEFMHVQKLDPLRVLFESATATVVIKRKPE